jgi:hypothetical protein
MVGDEVNHTKRWKDQLTWSRNTLIRLILADHGNKLIIIMAPQPFVRPCPLFQFLRPVHRR